MKDLLALLLYIWGCFSIIGLIGEVIAGRSDGMLSGLILAVIFCGLGTFFKLKPAKAKKPEEA